MLAPMSSSFPTNHRPHHHHYQQQHRHQNKHSHQRTSSLPSSVSTIPTDSEAQNHQLYLSRLPIPSLPSMQRIATVQSRKERASVAGQLSNENPGLSDEERDRAAKLIQRSYRGHRTRRMMDGRTLDPGERWVEAVKEAEWRRAVRPRGKGERTGEGEVNVNGEGKGAAQDAGEGNTVDGERKEGRRKKSDAKENWRRLGVIARRAGGDGDNEDEEAGIDEEDLPEHEREKMRQHRIEETLKRQEAAKMMDLQYFLEMVDLKHRYGSNLRAYHAEWKKADTNENFFYWLDYGEGRHVTVPGVPRERLDREQVRYLSKEERMKYLVKIDKEGRLCWAKNGVRIDTTTKYKDSIHGIVPYDDAAPAFSPIQGEADVHHHDGDSTSDSSDSGSEGEHTTDDESTRANKYASPEFDESKGIDKIKHISAATIFNKLLRKSVKKNTWIFVADTNFRLYVGIKQSGAFQHSSFLSAGRISDAGLIKIKDGRLTKLSPLSGHYRPPVSNFKSFVHSLKDEGVDMSHVSISRSYAVLVGLEAYVKTRRKAKTFVHKLADHRDKVIAPEEVEKREEAERDKSQSAQREQRFLEMKRQAEEEERGDMKAEIKLLDKLRIGHRKPLHHPKGGGREEVDIEKPGTGPENAIAPQGTRDE